MSEYDNWNTRLPELVAGMKNHNDEMTTTLLSHYGTKMVNLARTYTKNRADAEDVVQDAFVTVIRSIDTLQDSMKFESWMSTIVVNQAKMLLRKTFRTAEQSFTDTEGESEYQFDPSDEKIEFRPDLKIDQDTTRKMVLDILDELSEEQRIVVLMYFFEEKKLKEIAEELDIPMTSVVGRLTTAKKNIKASVTEVQNKYDIKLYNMAGIPAFMWLLGLYKAGYAPVDFYAGANAAEAVKPTKSSKAEKAVKSTAAAASTEVGKGVVGVAAKKGLSSLAKIIIGVAMAGGAGAAAYAVNNNINSSRKEPEPEVVVEEQQAEQEEVYEPVDEETPVETFELFATEPIEGVTGIQELCTVPIYENSSIVEYTGYPQEWDYNYSLIYDIDYENAQPFNRYDNRGIILCTDDGFAVYSYDGSMMSDKKFIGLSESNIFRRAFDDTTMDKSSLYVGSHYHNYFPNNPISYDEIGAHLFIVIDEEEPKGYQWFQLNEQYGTEMFMGGLGGDSGAKYYVKKENMIFDFFGDVQVVDSYDTGIPTVVAELDDNDEVVGSIYVDESGSFSTHFEGKPLDFVNGYILCTKDGKYGFVEPKSGNYISDTLYDDAKFFEEGYAPVKKDGKWGYIDTNGNAVTDFIFDDVSTLYEGKVYVVMNGSAVVLNLKEAIENGVAINAETCEISR